MKQLACLTMLSLLNSLAVAAQPTTYASMYTFSDGSYVDFSFDGTLDSNGFVNLGPHGSFSYDGAIAVSAGGADGFWDANDPNIVDIEIHRGNNFLSSVLLTASISSSTGNSKSLTVLRPKSQSPKSVQYPNLPAPHC